MADIYPFPTGIKRKNTITPIRSEVNVENQHCKEIAKVIKQHTNTLRTLSRTNGLTPLNSSITLKNFYPNEVAQISKLKDSLEGIIAKYTHLTPFKSYVYPINFFLTYTSKESSISSEQIEKKGKQLYVLLDHTTPHTNDFIVLRMRLIYFLSEVCFDKPNNPSTEYTVEWLVGYIHKLCNALKMVPPGGGGGPGKRGTDKNRHPSSNVVDLFGSRDSQQAA